MGSKPTKKQAPAVRSEQHGQAIVFKIKKKPIPNSERKLSVVEIDGGFKSVIPSEEFHGTLDDGKLAIFVPAGNAVPDDGYFAWMGTGRRKIVRKRNILGVKSDGIVIPLCQFERVTERILNNGVQPGDNLAATLGVFKGAPQEVKLKSKRSKRKVKTLAAEAKAFVETAEKRGAVLRADGDGAGFKSTVPIPPRLLREVGGFILERSKKLPPQGQPQAQSPVTKLPAEAQAILDTLNRRSEAARQRAYNGGTGVPIPKTSGVGGIEPGVEGFVSEEEHRQNIVRLNRLEEFLAQRLGPGSGVTRANSVSYAIGTIRGLENKVKDALADATASKNLVTRLTDTSKRFLVTNFVEKLAEKVFQHQTKPVSNDDIDRLMAVEFEKDGNGKLQSARSVPQQQIEEAMSAPRAKCLRDRCPNKFGTAQCDREVNHSGPHRTSDFRGM